MSNIVGADGVRGDHVKPIDCLVRGNCPCDSYLKCSTRPPYGLNVWSVRKKRKQACDTIAYDSEGYEADIEKCQEIFDAILKKSTSRYKNDFYKNIKRGSHKVMFFPPISEGQLLSEMSALNGKLHNAGKFTAFQKSVILRANMVKHGLELWSDVYEDGAGNVEFASEKLTPYHRKPLGKEWNIDHVQARAKGGCNRFCNAALLGSKNNKSKLDDGLGCPCADALQKTETAGEGQTEFSYSGSKVKKYDLYNCGVFCSTKVKQKKDKSIKLPAKPLGTMNHYKLLCGLDNPMVFIPDRSEIITKRADNYTQSGK